jgi:importin subunit beta-1
VCYAAVGLIGDICRSLSSAVLPHCDEIMAILLENLGNNGVQRQVKPQILSVFGDVALAIGIEFKKYLGVVMQMLMQASQAQVDRVSVRRPYLAIFNVSFLQSDFDMVDYLNELRESCLEAYTGIIQGLKGETTSLNPTPELALIQPHVPYMVQFITVVAQDSEHTDAGISACAGLIG